MLLFWRLLSPITTWISPHYNQILYHSSRADQRLSGWGGGVGLGRSPIFSTFLHFPYEDENKIPIRRGVNPPTPPSLPHRSASAHRSFRLLNVSESCSYLGIVLSSQCSFLQTQQNIADGGLNALYRLYKDTYELYNPKLGFLCSLFDKLVLPILDYGSEIWGLHVAPAVERVHLQCYAFKENDSKLFCVW